MTGFTVYANQSTQAAKRAHDNCRELAGKG